MTDPLPPSLDARMEQAAPRARRFLTAAATGAEATESNHLRRGPPDQADIRAIANRLRRAAPAGPGLLHGREPGAEANALAATLVGRAQRALAKLLQGGTPDGGLHANEALALEAVIQVRGRPALRVEAAGLEGLDPATHPESDFWRPLLDSHAQMMFTVASATGAVRVHDLEAPRSWVQGTAWLIGGNRAITNRHVLFPLLGLSLARRNPDVITARRKPDFEVTIDLACDDGLERCWRLPVTKVVYVAEDRDPIDVAVLEFAPPPGLRLPKRLKLAAAPFERTRLYVVGHPGRLDPSRVSADIQAVFGSPDERKRVSLGELMDADPARPYDLRHDASSIGGYSGGCVVGFLTPEVGGLHYYGDAESGNRAILSTALKSHAVGEFL